MATAESVQIFADGSAYLFLLSAAVASGGATPDSAVGTLLALSFAAAAARLLASDIVKRLTVGEYPPPRNRT